MSQFKNVCTKDLIKNREKKKININQSSSCKNIDTNDSISFLEQIRQYQLYNILNKYKLF